MKYLLDTHILIWFINGDRRLDADMRDKIINGDNQIYISAASLWEMTVKISLGKLELNRGFSEIFPSVLDQLRITILPIEMNHLSRLLELPFIHRDPFDRLIIVQSLCEKLFLLTDDTQINRYPVNQF